MDGRLHFTLDNDFALPESGWPASPIYLDATVGPIGMNQNFASGEPVISDRVTKYSETPTPAGGGDERYFGVAYRNAWGGMGVAATYDSLPLADRQRAAQLLVAPKLLSTGTALFPGIKGGIHSRNYGTCLALRGGTRNGGIALNAHNGAATNSGLGFLNLRSRRDYYGGFRVAYIG